MCIFFVANLLSYTCTILYRDCHRLTVLLQKLKSALFIRTLYSTLSVMHYLCLWTYIFVHYVHIVSNLLLVVTVIMHMCFLFLQVGKKAGCWLIAARNIRCRKDGSRQQMWYEWPTRGDKRSWICGKQALSFFAWKFLCIRTKFSFGSVLLCHFSFISVLLCHLHSVASIPSFGANCVTSCHSVIILLELYHKNLEYYSFIFCDKNNRGNVCS